MRFGLNPRRSGLNPKRSSRRCCLSQQTRTFCASPPTRFKPSILEREFFIENLLVRLHLIIKMILVDRPDAVGV